MLSPIHCVSGIIHLCLQVLVLAVMTTMVDRKDQIVSWNGDPTTWMEYVKRVRFQYERTEVKKRVLLGAELVSRLTGRAWEVATADVDHQLLQQSDGAAYLLRFLEDRLCKAPVPDTGQRLEDFFIRLRRQPGASMTEWATQVRESYRRLQRAMARQRRDMDVREGKLKVVTPEPSSPSKRSNATPSQRRRSDVTSPPAQGEQARTDFFPDGEEEIPQEGNPGSLDEPEDREEPNDGYQRVPTSPPASDRDGAWGGGRWWSAEEWAAWYADRDEGSSFTVEAAHEEKQIEWDQFDFGNINILPSEILGWIMLRRSGLPASSRLSVLSAINNKLDLDTIERAMRDQEEELLLSEHHRRGDVPRPRRSFWVEESGQWGLLSEPDMEDYDEQAVMWVGHRLPPEVYESHEDEQEATSWVSVMPDGQELVWEWQDDDFYAADHSGVFWSWAETKTWLDCQDCLAFQSRGCW